MIVQTDYVSPWSEMPLVRTYSDAGVMIRQVETGDIYDEAIDVKPCRYHYEETDEPVEGGGDED